MFSPFWMPKNTLTASSSHNGECPVSSSRLADPEASTAAPATSSGQTRLPRAASADDSADQPRGGVALNCKSSGLSSSPSVDLTTHFPSPEKSSRMSHRSNP
jgi:hypothetical protein